MRLRVLAAGALTALALASFSPAHAATPLYPAVSIVDLGGTRFISQAAPDALLCGVQLFLRAGLDRQEPNKSGVAALVAESVLRTPVDGVSLQDRIAQDGGSINYAIEGQYAHIYVEGLAAHVPALLGYLQRAIAAPDLSSTNVAAARAALAARIDDAMRNPLSIGVSTFKRSFYASSNAGLPELGSKSTLAGLLPADAQAFYAGFYRSGGALVTAVGDVTPQTTAAAKALVAALPPGMPAAATLSGTLQLDGASKRLIVRGDTRTPWLVFGFAAPAPGTHDFSAMLVLEALLSKTFDEAGVTTASAMQRRFGSLYFYDSKPATLVVYSNGVNIEPQAAINQVNLTLAALSRATLQKDAVKKLSAVAEGLFLTRNMALVDQAWLLGNFALQGLPPDYANAALRGMASVTAADVTRLARRYLKKYTLAIVLPQAPRVQGVESQQR